jgi:alkanesulfonate monooxygenase SsuD/methylene tetrahydromethanopterin reductase-like flavin-dependent oxidoreductase (luciferase family)
MKFSILQLVGYADEGLEPGWPVPGSRWEPQRGLESMRRAFELFDMAVDAGFDMITVAEHHYGANSLVPSPAVLAAALAQRYSDVTIGMLGPVLPLSQPVRIAEEIAMVDVISGGRTLVGLFRGVPNEHLVSDIDPAATRDMFAEALALILRAWTEPEAFGWEGRNYRVRTVSTFPRPIQLPHPPLVLAATSPEAARWNAERGFLLGIFGATVSLERAAEFASAYRDEAAARGRPAADSDIVYRAHVYVADSDAQADADQVDYGIGNVHLLMAPEAQRAEAAGKVLQALFRGPGGPARGQPPSLPRDRPEFIGSPESVVAQIRASREQIGWGLLDGVFTYPRLPWEKARHSLELFAQEVLPALR